ncbi:hypothetical protein CTM88_19980 [Photobacterium aquimaris]|uniref:Acyltransferase 3 domain-containing protein n=1 Tax=Photobacterium aquimaris TaxID=512643 RepID=A0A2T3IET1_9GAMM|nr:hypothetical protein [Photobacterium aquimaris]PSU23315.1 hypothetical protein CTM88_19980 [Photobacterium aquimaris]
MKAEIEFFRVLSMFGIIYFHSGYQHFKFVAYGGLVFFTVTAVFFYLQSDKKVNINRYIIPWSFWFLFYAIFSYLVNGYVFHNETNIFTMVFASPSLHLWFVPFISILFLFFGFFPYIFFNKLIGLFSCWFSIFLIVTYSQWDTSELTLPLAQYFHIIPAVLIAISFYSYTYNNDKYIMVSLFLLYGIVFLLIIFNNSNYAITYFFGLLPCLYLLKSKFIISKDSFLFKVSSSTFGVYFVHIFMFSFFRYFGLEGLFLLLSVFVCSYIGVFFSRRILPHKVTTFLFG